MKNALVDETTSNIINMSAAGTGVSLSRQAAIQNCQYMRLKIGAMPFLQPVPGRDATSLYVNCRSLYGKSYRGRMIASPQGLSQLLLEEFQLAVDPCQVSDAADAIRLSGGIPKEHMHAGLEKIELMVGEIIQ